MKIRNIFLSLLIILVGVLTFAGCNSNANLKLTVNGAEGYILCSEVNEQITGTETFTVKSGKTVTINAVANNGYEFVGWYKDKEMIQIKNDRIKVDSNISLTAKFAKINYTVSFDFNGGLDEYNATEKTPLTNVKVGEQYSLPVLHKDDHKFIGWFYNNVKVCEGGNIHIEIPRLSEEDATNKSFTLTAIFKHERTVTFNVDGVITNIVAYQGEEIEFPTAQKEGYEFIGWKTQDNQDYTSNVLIEDADLTLIAQFKKTYELSFIGTQANFETRVVREGDEITLPYPTYTEQYPQQKLVAWKVQGTNEVYTNKITFNYSNNIVLESVISDRYEIKYYTNGGETSYLSEISYIYNYDTFSKVNLPTPTRTAPCSKYNSAVPDFRCWTYKNQIITPETVFNEDHNITLIAMWDVYLVYYNYDSNKLFESETIGYDFWTGDQKVKDALAFKAYMQSAVSSERELLDNTGEHVKYYTLNENRENRYKITDTDLFKTVKEYFEKTKTMAEDGIEQAGINYENKLPFTFEIADEEGNPVITTTNHNPGVEIAKVESANISMALDIYVATVNNDLY